MTQEASASPVQQHSPAELHAAARKKIASGDLEGAEETLAIAFALDEHDTEAMCIMADLFETAGQVMEAVGYAVLAINSGAPGHDIRKKFLRLARDMSFTHRNEKVESAILNCLETPGLEFGGANVLWGNAQLINPEFGDLFARVVRKRLLPLGNPFDEVTDFSPLLRPFFLLGIAEIVVCFMPFEIFMTHLRRFLLEQQGAAKQKLAEKDYFSLVTAVARYAFHSDYIMDVTAKEQKAADALRARVEAGEQDAGAVALLGCYVPLYCLKNADAIEKHFSGADAMGALMKLQIAEYRLLQEKARAVTAATPIADEISAKVKDMYEQFPYPRWRELEETEITWRDRDTAVLSRPGATALVAGCGTGRESSQLAAAYPQAGVLAIDITTASLAYAMQKAEQYKLANLSYRQADIFKLDALGKTFDYIHCVGVLHHLGDPEKGWEMLARQLNPGGVMHIGLYGETPRRAIVEARAAIARGKFPPTHEGMRRFRKESASLLKPESLATLLKARDYYFLTMYSDLLFHVHEDRFTIPRIQAALEKLGLVFGGFKLPETVLDEFRKMFPDDPKGLELGHWAAFEKMYPDTFIHSYKFWCRKKETAA